MKLELSLDLPSTFERVLAENTADAAALFPNQLRAIQALAMLTQQRWIEYASGARPLPGGRTLNRQTGNYAASIKISREGVLRYVVYSDSPIARYLEDGWPAWDMKKLLRTSHKARVSKDGTRYMVFPFRHKTPGSLGVTMPNGVREWWRAGREASVVTGHYTEASVQDGQTRVTRNTYLWGDRLSAADVAGLGLDPEREGRRLVGMVRFANDEDRGGRYMTFRTMSEKSKGWTREAQEGYAPARAAFEFLEQHYEGVMRIALEEDVRRLSR